MDEVSQIEWPTGGTMIIFVVDDERLIASTIAIILSRQGYEVYPFQSPYAALAKARDCAPDVLLTDIAMPGMNGIELADALVTLRPCCDVICFSGHAEQRELLNHLLYRPGWNLLVKPIHPRDLIEEIRAKCARKQQGDLTRFGSGVPAQISLHTPEMLMSPGITGVRVQERRSLQHELFVS